MSVAKPGEVGFVGIEVEPEAAKIHDFKQRITGYLADKPLRKLLMVPALGTFRATMKSMDYEEYGGVPLLGVKGVSIIGHGKSTPKAIMNMILKAKEMVEKKINERIGNAMDPA